VRQNVWATWRTAPFGQKHFAPVTIYCQLRISYRFVTFRHQTHSGELKEPPTEWRPTGYATSPFYAIAPIGLFAGFLEAAELSHFQD
jgi:hypothetical protein